MWKSLCFYWFFLAYLCYLCEVTKSVKINFDLLSKNDTTQQKNSTTVLKFTFSCKTPNHDGGVCIPIRDCDIFMKNIKHKPTREFIRASLCGDLLQNPTNPYVCCGTSHEFKPDLTLLPKDCGVQKIINKGRIFGGTEASLGEFPWMARLMFQNELKQKHFGCGGFLIHKRFVLTAAHCLVPPDPLRGKIHSVVLGEHNTRTEPDCSKGGKKCAEPIQTVRVKTATPHRFYSYKDKQFHNDIAIIELIKSVKISSFVQPICLLQDPQEAKLFIASGWGKTNIKNSPPLSPTKQRVELNLFQFKNCSEIYRKYEKNIVHSQICAGGTKGKDTCAGDSGGPLMYYSTNESVWKAAGVVSYGIDCGQKDIPGIYTKISSYLNWIKCVIKKKDDKKCYL